MRPSNKSRSRNKPGNSGANHNNQRRSTGSVINRVYESPGPDGKVRGTPQQIIDKYQALARDAQLAGDRVAAESFLQHSEHYSRLLGEAQREQDEQRGAPEREEGNRGGDGQDGGRQPQFQPQPQSQPQHQTQHQPRAERPLQPVASGLTTIDTIDGDDDRDDMSGPVETPENARMAQPTRVPARQPDAAPDRQDGETPAATEVAAPKRGRPRRKAKPDAEPAEAPVVQAD